MSRTSKPVVSPWATVSARCFWNRSVTDAVDLFIHLQDLPGTLQVESGKALVNQVEHFAQHG